MTKREHLVLGATGKTGRRVVRRLRAAGEDVRAASRSSAIHFDWHDRSSWAPALSGASTIYLVAPDDPSLAPDFVDEAVASGVRRFVVLSGAGIEHSEGFGHAMIATERAVRETDAEWTILRATNFLQNFSEDIWLASIRAGRLALPIGDVPEPFVDVEDVAAMAVAALTEDHHQQRIYRLTGPEAITFAEATAAIGRACNRTLTYEEVTPRRYGEELRAAGISDEFALELIEMFALLRTGINTRTSDDVRSVLRREPGDIATYARTLAVTGVWNPH